ncbi:MAG: nucleotide exchange factor GrpE [Candidatus Riflebacteria bacterium]|nr:nucleotide exchange factor GrpE [Candidatus Riflebacteria bacterium]
MSSDSFDDVVKNLLVFLKGQIPALQSRSNADDLQRNINSMVTTIRSIIGHIEEFSGSDSRMSPALKAIHDELDKLKRTNARLEDSEILWIKKHKQLLDEIKKAAENSRQQEELISGLNSQLTGHQQQIGEQAASITEKDRLITELQTQLQQLQTQLRDYPTDIANSEKKGFANAVHEFQPRIDHLQVMLSERDTALANVNGDASKREEVLRNTQETLIATETRLKEAHLEIDRLCKELAEIIARPPVSLPSDQERIKELELKVESLKRELRSSQVMEVYRNTQSAAEARIGFLEKNLAEARARIHELENRPPDAADQKIEQVQHEKNLLQARTSELEETVRRLISEQTRGAKAPPGSSIQGEEASRSEVWDAQEVLFLFESFVGILEVIPNTAEYREIRRKIRNALQLLEQNHSLQVIPTTGTTFQDRLHKIVKIYYSTILDDGTIVSETTPGFKLNDQILKRAMVGVAKSNFLCSNCSTVSRQTDFFCSKCGLEICASDGTPKRRLPPLPSALDIILPLIDILTGLGQTEKVKALLIQAEQNHPGNTEIKKRRQKLETP